MRRRDFLQSAVGLAALAWPMRAFAGRPETYFRGELVRAGAGGRVLASRDGGLNWRLLAEFPPIDRVTGLETHNGELHASVRFQTTEFVVRSRDGLHWREVI